MATAFRHPTRNTYYYRCRIPLNLRHFFGHRVEFWRSLHTADRDEARLRSALWEVRVQQVFTILKAKGARMTSTEIAALVSKWMETTLEESEDYRAVCGPVTDEYREGVYHVLSDQFDEAGEALVSCDYSSVEKEATALLTGAGITLAPSSIDFGKFCRRLLRAKQAVLRIEADRWEGTYPDDVATLGIPTPAPTATAPTPSTSKPFSEVLATYCKENPRPIRTRAQVDAEYGRFMDGLDYRTVLLRRLPRSRRPTVAGTKTDCSRCES